MVVGERKGRNSERQFVEETIKRRKGRGKKTISSGSAYNPLLAVLDFIGREPRNTSANAAF